MSIPLTWLTTAQRFSQRSENFFQQHPLGQYAKAAGQSRYFWAALLVLTSLFAIRFGLSSLALGGQLALFVFACAMVAWSVLKLDETPVAIAAGLALVLFKTATPEQLYAGMGDGLIWLLIASFTLAAVLQQSGVAQRGVWMLLGAGSKNSTDKQAAIDIEVSGITWAIRPLFVRITWMIIATAFIVPSTSGRAALLLPVFLLIAQHLQSAELRRALALLFPTVILLSACASLLGAGAHLVAVEFMAHMELSTISYAHWALLGTPFAIASSFAAMHVILHLFVPAQLQSTSLFLPSQPAEPLTKKQWTVIGIMAATVLGWAMGSWWAVDATLVALIAILAATTKSLTGVSMKTALKSVEWNLILFLAATMVMGKALLESGAAQALAEQAQALLPLAWRNQTSAVLIFVSVLALLSHVVITSRTARALVLIPTLAVPMAIGGIHAQALIFVVVVASGFCQTFSVSAKPVALFSNETQSAFSDKDLMRLSLWLLPVMLVLLVLFAQMVWPLMGMPLSSGAATCTPSSVY